MSKAGSPDIGFILYDGKNIVNDLTNITIEEEAEIGELTGLGDSTDEWGFTGISMFDMNMNGYYDSTDDLFDDVLDLSGNRQTLINENGNVLGGRVTALLALRNQKNRQSSSGEFNRVDASFKSYGAIYHAAITSILNEKTETTNNGDSVDNGVETSNGTVGIIHLTNLDLDGGSKLVVSLQDSDDDSIFADLVVFDDITTSPNYQTVPDSGTSERYVRTKYTFTGSGAGRTATFVTALTRL